MLDSFADHPYGIREDVTMLRMEESVKEHGILQPLIVRPKSDGRYEVISGHRRSLLAIKAGLETVPVIVKEMTDDQAVIFMVESNIQRESTLPSERAKSYKMWMDAMKRQGERTDLTSVDNQQKLKSETTRKGLSKQTGFGEDIVRMYLCLNNLTSELLEIVDNSEIVPKHKGLLQMSPRIGEVISTLSEYEQRDLFEAMEDNEATPSKSQAMRLKNHSQKLKMLDPSQHLTIEQISKIMQEEKPNQKETLKFSHQQYAQIKKYFPRTVTPKQIQSDIIEGLKLLRERERRRKLKREKGGGAR